MRDREDVGDDLPGGGGARGGPGGQDGPGRLRLTDPRALVALATVGLVLGWAVRPVTRWQDWPTPVVSWFQVLGLLLAAAILGGLALQTRRALRPDPARRRGRLRPHEAMNRMVLGKACALVGALAAGGYAGAALSWVGALSELAGENVLRSLLALLTAVLMLVGGLALERACRIEDDPPAA